MTIATLPAILLAALGVGMMILALFGCLAHLASGQRHRWDWGPATSQPQASDQPALCPNCKQKPRLDSWPYCETCLLNDESLWEDSE